MNAWPEFLIVLVGFLLLLLKSGALKKITLEKMTENESYGNLHRELFLTVYCTAMLFISLVILLFKTDDAVVSWLTSLVFLVSVLLQSFDPDSKVGHLVLPIINFSLAASLAVLASVEPLNSGQHPALKAAQVTSTVAMYAIVISLPKSS